MGEIVVTDRPGVREVAFDRPAKRNALTGAMYGALGEALAGAARPARARSGCTAARSASPPATTLATSPAPCPASAPPRGTFLEALIACETPIVASVNGAAVGVGTTLLLHCDLVYCSAAARFQLPFVNLGLCPEAASSLLLPARAGALRAAELLLLGEPFDAAAASDAGLVNAVLPTPAEADATALSRAEALAAKPAAALRATRALLRRDRPAVLAAMRAEGEAFARLLHAPEAAALAVAAADCPPQRTARR